VEPLPLSKSFRDHPSIFASCLEWDNPPDGEINTTFVFRNRERTVFGIRQWQGDLPRARDLFPKMAYRIVTDPVYRKTLVSDDPELPELWKHH
jgi:hypothetical protein